MSQEIRTNTLGGLGRWLFTEKLLPELWVQDGKDRGMEREYIAVVDDRNGATSFVSTEPIVRCKDCTFAKPTKTENVIQCTWLSGYTFRIDHYCSAGERTEE